MPEAWGARGLGCQSVPESSVPCTSTTGQQSVCRYGEQTRISVPTTRKNHARNREQVAVPGSDAGAACIGTHTLRTLARRHCIPTVAPIAHRARYRRRMMWTPPALPPRMQQHGIRIMQCRAEQEQEERTLRQISPTPHTLHPTPYTLHPTPRPSPHPTTHTPSYPHTPHPTLPPKHTHTHRQTQRQTHTQTHTATHRPTDTCSHTQRLPHTHKGRRAKDVRSAQFSVPFPQTGRAA